MADTHTLADIWNMLSPQLSVKLGNVSNKQQILYRPEKPEWMGLFSSLFTTDYFPLHWVLKLKFNRTKLFNYRLTLAQIARKIESAFSDFRCVFTPPNYHTNELWIWIDVSGINTEKGDPISADEAPEIYIHDVVLPTLLAFDVGGNAKGALRMFPRQETLANSNVEWIVDTEGQVRLLDVFSLPFVDSTRTTSDNVWEIYETLGLMAARNFLVKEIRRVVCFDGTDISERHIELLVDSMLFAGPLTSVSRYGIEREEVGPIAKCTFEEPMSNLARAGIFGETDDASGIAASVTIGKTIPSGTGGMDILVDIEKLSAGVKASTILEDDEYT